MSVSLMKVLVRETNILQLGMVRYGHRMRGKPPGMAKSLKDYLNELNYKDPSLHYKVDIGFPKPKPSRSKELKERLSILKSNRTSELEKLSRNKQLVVELDKVKEEWLKTSGPFHIRQVAEHYGIFQDLFGDAYFTPRVMLDIKYKMNDDSYLPVHRGNIIKPNEASTIPEVDYNSDPNTLWTLALTNPDGHFTEKEAEYVHWMMGNIPGCDISHGEVIWEYLQPFPPRGTGFHRLVYILYKQDRKLDFSTIKKEGPCLSLKDRTFSTYEFYRERQDDMTPAGLAFFQSDWDPSLTEFFHNTLEMKEPVYEYDFPKPYIKPQRWFPKKQPFNTYMDKYQDPKDVARRYILKKLQNKHPFKTSETSKFPNAFRMNEKIPSWLRVEMKKDRLGWGRINDV